MIGEINIGLCCILFSLQLAVSFVLPDVPSSVVKALNASLGDEKQECI